MHLCNWLRNYSDYFIFETFPSSFHLKQSMTVLSETIQNGRWASGTLCDVTMTKRRRNPSFWRGNGRLLKLKLPLAIYHSLIKIPPSKKGIPSGRDGLFYLERENTKSMYFCKRAWKSMKVQSHFQVKFKSMFTSVVSKQQHI